MLPSSRCAARGTEILVVARSMFSAQFGQFKEEYPKLRFELVSIDTDGGTADALRQIRDKIKVPALRPARPSPARPPFARPPSARPPKPPPTRGPSHPSRSPSCSCVHPRRIAERNGRRTLWWSAVTS